MKRRLFANERELRSLGGITLTTHRVIAYDRHGNGSASTSLQLDQVQWTRLARGSRPELKVAAAVIGLLGLGLLFEGILVIGAMLGAIALCMALLNVMWRRTAMEIGSGSGRIKAWIEDEPDRQRQARSFLDAIDHAAAGELSDLDAVVALARRHLHGASGKESCNAAHE